MHPGQQSFLVFEELQKELSGQQIQTEVQPEL
jgi:hypothetical protein